MPGTAEVTTLASHWFDPLVAKSEYTRILKPVDWAALVWNNRRKSGSPFLEGCERILRAYGIGYAAPPAHPQAGGPAALFEAHAMQGQVAVQYDTCLYFKPFTDVCALAGLTAAGFDWLKVSQRRTVT